jgi:hypothetical protein
MEAEHLYCPNCGLERAPNKVVTAPARSAVPTRNPIEHVRLVIGSIVLIVIVIVCVVVWFQQNNPAQYNSGYSYGYHHYDSNSFAIYEACNDAPLNLQTNTAWQNGCTAGTDDARAGKAYNP